MQPDSLLREVFDIPEVVAASDFPADAAGRRAVAEAAFFDALNAGKSTGGWGA